MHSELPGFGWLCDALNDILQLILLLFAAKILCVLMADSTYTRAKCK